MSTRMIDTKGADYVAAWTRQIAAKFNTTPEGLAHFAAKHGAASVGDLTPEQARNVIADLTFYSRADRADMSATYARANKVNGEVWD